MTFTVDANGQNFFTVTAINGQANHFDQPDRHQWRRVSRTLDKFGSAAAKSARYLNRQACCSSVRALSVWLPASAISFSVKK